jgi:hypothetical protein
MPRRTKSRRNRTRTRRNKRRSLLSGVTSTTGRVTRGVTSGISSVGRTVTGTAKKSVGSFFGLFGMKKSRRHRRK